MAEHNGSFGNNQIFYIEKRMAADITDKLNLNSIF